MDKVINVQKTAYNWDSGMFISILIKIDEILSRITKTIAYFSNSMLKSRCFFVDRA